MSSIYLQTTLILERLHRRFLDVVNYELVRLKVLDINNVQTMILYNIQDDELTIGELTDRGYYLGSNVSYNVKKMVEAGYLELLPNIHDKRSMRVRVSEKGKALCLQIDTLFAGHIQELQKSDPGLNGLHEAHSRLKTLEQLWGSAR